MYINMITITSRNMLDNIHSWKGKRKALIMINNVENRADPLNPHMKLKGLIFGSIRKHNPYIRNRLSLQYYRVRYDL